MVIQCVTLFIGVKIELKLISVNFNHVLVLFSFFKKQQGICVEMNEHRN